MAARYAGPEAPRDGRESGKARRLLRRWHSSFGFKAPREGFSASAASVDDPAGKEPMNQIIYLVGVIVIVLFVLGYFGLR